MKKSIEEDDEIGRVLDTQIDSACACHLFIFYFFMQTVARAISYTFFVIKKFKQQHMHAYAQLLCNLYVCAACTHQMCKAHALYLFIYLLFCMLAAMHDTCASVMQHETFNFYAFCAAITCVYASTYGLNFGKSRTFEKCQSNIWVLEI